VDKKQKQHVLGRFYNELWKREELIIDFGLNPQPVGVPKDPIQVKQRIIVNYYTAKRLLAALNMSVQRHEAVFGVLETDIQKQGEFYSNKGQRIIRRRPLTAAASRIR